LDDNLVCRGLVAQKRTRSNHPFIFDHADFDGRGHRFEGQAVNDPDLTVTITDQTRALEAACGAGDTGSVRAKQGREKNRGSSA
jgi:hypothetical protein